MTTLTPAVIANIASGVGFKGDALVKAVAVALAESGGNPAATNTNTDKYRSVDRGLWQINSHWHPEVSAAQAFNPAQAARHAYRISKGGTDWSQWATWPVAATVHMGRARLAAHPYLTATTVTVNPTTGATTTQPVGWREDLAEKVVPLVPWQHFTDPGATLAAPGNMLAAASQGIALAAKAAAWLADSHNWARVGFVVGGGMALLLGAQQLAASGSLGSTAASASGTLGKAASLVPVAKVAKAAKAAKAVK